MRDVRFVWVKCTEEKGARKLGCCREWRDRGGCYQDVLRKMTCGVTNQGTGAQSATDQGSDADRDVE